MLLRQLLSLGAATLASAQPNLAQTFKLMEDQSFEAPFGEISAYTGMRDLTAFEVGGSAVVHRNFLRLTGERQSQKGWVASRTPLAAPEWSALLELRASGTSMHLYGDGEPAPPRTRATPCGPGEPSRGTVRAQAWRSGLSPTRITSRARSSAGKITGRVSASSSTLSRTWTTRTTTSTRTFTPSRTTARKGACTPPRAVTARTCTRTPSAEAVGARACAEPPPWPRRYIPDAEKPDPAKQALPGSVDNSGCSFEFRYLETRHDVSVLNHTRVHVTYKDKVRHAPPPRAAAHHRAATALPPRRHRAATASPPRRHRAPPRRNADTHRHARAAPPAPSCLRLAR